MGFFKRHTRPRLPADVIDAMARYGAAAWREDYDKSDVVAFDSETYRYDSELRAMPPDQQRAWVEKLAERVLPVGGWPVYGAEELVRKALIGDRREIPAYHQILEAKLAFQREGGIWWGQLRGDEKSFWRQWHPDEVWLSPRDPPSRAEAMISPLAIGEKRQLTRMTSAANSRGVYVVRRSANSYILALDYEDDEGNRAVDEREDLPDLYDLYLRLGQNMTFPTYWAAPDLWPFLAHPAPRLAPP